MVRRSSGKERQPLEKSGGEGGREGEERGRRGRERKKEKERIRIERGNKGGMEKGM